MKLKSLKRLTLADLDCYDGVYNVSKLVDIDGSPWVVKEAAEEILDIANAELDAFLEYLEHLENIK